MKTICSHCNGKPVLPHWEHRGNYCYICHHCLGSGAKIPDVRGQLEESLKLILSDPAEFEKYMATLGPKFISISEDERRQDVRMRLYAQLGILKLKAEQNG